LAAFTKQINVGRQAHVQNYNQEAPGGRVSSF